MEVSEVGGEEVGGEGGEEVGGEEGGIEAVIVFYLGVGEVIIREVFSFEIEFGTIHTQCMKNCDSVYCDPCEKIGR